MTRVAMVFYERLFEIAPHLEPMFSADIQAQGAKLMDTLTSVVAILDRPEAIEPIAQDLGLHHSALGVERQHYALVGQALLWALERSLGQTFTPDVKDAWSVAYQLLSQAMIESSLRGTPPINRNS